MKEEHKQQLDGIFHKLSKAVIIIPIVVLLVAMAIKTRDKVTGYQQADSKSAQLTPAPVQARPSSMPDKSAVKLDLKGPLVCNYSADGKNTNIYIKDRKIYVKILKEEMTEEVVVREDCMYRWQTGQSTGDKTCGIGTYLTLFDTLSSFGMLDIDSLMGSLSQFTGENPSAAGMSPPAAADIAKACLVNDIPEVAFTVPTNIRFTETPLVQPTETAQ